MKSWSDLRHIEGPFLGVSEVVSGLRWVFLGRSGFSETPTSGHCLKTALDEVLAMHPKLEQFPEHSVIWAVKILVPLWVP